METPPYDILTSYYHWRRLVREFQPNCDCAADDDMASLCTLDVLVLPYTMQSANTMPEIATSHEYSIRHHIRDQGQYILLVEYPLDSPTDVRYPSLPGALRSTDSDPPRSFSQKSKAPNGDCL